ncbi:MAG: pyruvate, phosphate dikinase [Myxococcales bacterium]|nr:pyruvate, phosphate dikinase [Myxococcales bacterium]
MTQHVYLFTEGRAAMRTLLGGKGANLAEMTRIGLPVPPGFTITAATCLAYGRGGGTFPEGLNEQVETALAVVEGLVGRRFGAAERPLLVSVRSGAAVSMPGMMDTVLNLGLNDATVLAHARDTGDARFAWDCYRRFLQMFGSVVLGVAHHEFEHVLAGFKARLGVQADTDLAPADLQELVAAYQALIVAEAGQAFPQEPRAQLEAALRAVFGSWDNPRAKVYRRVHKIADDMGTAVNVQSMVFGNMGQTSATGVVFTRDPSTGEKTVHGEYLLNAQGEDVVAGIRTPHPIAQMQAELPDAFAELYATSERLEAHFGDMQDIEFTVERGKLWMLQCRTGKRAPGAAIRIAADFVREGKIDKAQAVLRVTPEDLQKAMHPRIDPAAALDVIARGQPASPGAAQGQLCFDPDEAVRLHAAGGQVLLVRPETTPDDIHGMVASTGFVTTRGGTTCHAAIVARGMGKPCVVGCADLHIDFDAGQLHVGARTIAAGQWLTIDGGDGRIVVGRAPLVDASMSGDFAELLGWADEFRRLKVRANADNPPDAEKARAFGAEGIGLCRTEHMFGQGGHHPERMAVVQRMILADTQVDRQAALDELFPMQRDDFDGILRAMAPHPVTIRLLDPPLHEFLPAAEDLAVAVAVARAEGRAAPREEKLLAAVRQLAEVNPMLGLRGVRLGLVMPEVYEMQVRALITAAENLHMQGIPVRPEIMIPLVGHVEELRRMKAMIDRITAELQPNVSFQVGTMIEVPRAALTAGAIAGIAEFFSFGTNDLTQMTWGYSRDDAEGGFLAQYVADKVLAVNPFVSIDRDGVGRLIQMACVEGRAVRPNLHLGICGEHGGDPDSIAFCHAAGLDYVSCSPYRVPVARLAAAQAALAAGGAKASTSAV